MPLFLGQLVAQALDEILLVYRIQVEQHNQPNGKENHIGSVNPDATFGPFEQTRKSEGKNDHDEQSNEEDCVSPKPPKLLFWQREFGTRFLCLFGSRSRRGERVTQCARYNGLEFSNSFKLGCLARL